MVELSLCIPDEAPVPLPRFVVNPLKDLDFLLEALHVGGANHWMVAVADLIGQANDPLAHTLACLQKPGVEVLDLLVASSLDVAWVLGRVVGHHDEWISVESIDLESRPVVHRGVGRSPHCVPPQLSCPLLNPG